MPTVTVQGDRRVVITLDKSTVTKIRSGQSSVSTGGMGLQGPPGPPGANGASGNVYVHTQAVASATWTVNHDLGVKPDVELLTVGGHAFDALVRHVSDSLLIVEMNTPLAGTARCS